jgi:NAD(P)-dependent dehydrogenase (short-subunit alcohol dehydrogenase family)
MSATDSATGSSLAGRVVLVAGATRGGGRGIARALGEAGATVYCTGRSTRARASAARAAAAAGRAAPSGGARSPFELEHRPETIEETAEIVSAAGGRGIAVEVDHTQPEAVRALLERIAGESGRLDVLVNDIWGGEALVDWGKSFWELDPERAFAVITGALKAHLVTSRFAAPLMVERRRGLIVEVTDGDALYYRTNLAYDLVKVAHIRMAFGMAEELAPHGVTALALTPGFIRSEAMLELFGVSEANWRDGVAQDPHFAFSETPLYLGRAVAALAADEGVARHAGRALSTWALHHEYGFVDADGSAPDWGAHARSEAFGRDQAASQQRFLEGFLERARAAASGG